MFDTYLAPQALVIVSASVCLLIIGLSRQMTRLAGRASDLASVQAAHSALTPRTGGIGIFIAFLLSTTIAPTQLADPYRSFALATSVLFLVGLAEDLGWHMTPWRRISAAIVACVLVICLLEAWTPRLDWPAIDPWMESGLIGIPLTVFAIVGLSNAFNLIDGVNGLASFAALVCAVSMGLISHTAGNSNMATLTMLLALAVIGFFVLNFPFGWIFLGDAGAYTIGFILGWFGVALVIQSPTVTPWALLLTMFWPIFDTMLALYRRGLRKAPAMQPDRLHVHQLVMRTLEICWLGRGRRHIANPLTTVVLAPLITLPALVGIRFWNEPASAFLAFLLLLLGYFGAYALTLNFVRSGLLRRVVQVSN